MTDWKAFGEMFRKRIWLVIMIIVLFVSAAAYISKALIKPQYQATTQLYVMITEGDRITYNDMQASQALVNNYKEMITSRAVTSQVIEELGLPGETYKSLEKHIGVELIPNSSMIKLTVTYDDPVMAPLIANALSNTFIMNIRTLTNMSNITLVDPAVGSEKPLISSANLIVAFSILFAILFSLALILILVQMDDTLKGLEEVENSCGIPVIGMIPEVSFK